MTSQAFKNLRLAGNGATLRLGPLLAQGGEGRVHRIDGDGGRLAKLYKQPLDAAKSRKLEVMVARAATAPAFVAWPQDVIRDDAGRNVGFVMPAVAGQEDIHELYGPKSREAAFPEADFRFLVHVAGNVARAFASVHERDVVIGDVNPGGLLVSPKGRVSLIDADSFQVRNGAELFTCDVGVATFTPPELQGKPFRSLHRTENHDLFGLAVILFHLLVMGRHPFVGRFDGIGDMPIERAIREHRYAYGDDSQQRWQMRPPPGTVRPNNFGNQIAGYFAHAFRPEAAVVGRPDAPRWVQVLDWLKSELVPCKNDPSHHHLRSLKACTWCRLEKLVPVRLFGVHRPPAGGNKPVDIDALWAPIAAITAPPASILPEKTPVNLPSPEHTLALRILCGGAVVVGVAALQLPELQGWSLALSAVGVATWPGAPWFVRARARQEFQRAERELGTAVAQLDIEAGDAPFSKEMRRLEGLRNELAAFPQRRAARMIELTRRARETQFKHFLDRCRLDRAKVSGVGPGRLATLASYGIETAADISDRSLRSVPQIGPKIASRLLAWRRQQEARFKFDPKAPLDPQDVARIDRDIQHSERRIVTELENGPRRLRAIREQILQRREAAMNTIRDLHETRERAAVRYIRG